MSRREGYIPRWGKGPRPWEGEPRYGDRLDDPDGYSDNFLSFMKAKITRMKADRMHLREQGEFDRSEQKTTKILAYKKARFAYMNLPHDLFENGHSSYVSFKGARLCRACTLFLVGAPVFGAEKAHVRRMMQRGRLHRVNVDSTLANLGRPWSLDGGENQ